MRYQMIDAANYRGLKRFKHLIIPLLSQNIRKAHQLSVAMESKGFRDGPRTYYYNVPFSYKDIIFIIVLIAIITMAYYCSITLPITGIDDVRLGRRLNFIHNCIDTKLEIHCIEKKTIYSILNKEVPQTCYFVHPNMLWRLFVLHMHNHKFGTEINVLDSTIKSYEKSIVIDSFIANLSILNLLI